MKIGKQIKKVRAPKRDVRKAGEEVGIPVKLPSPKKVEKAE